MKLFSWMQNKLTGKQAAGNDTINNRSKPAAAAAASSSARHMKQESREEFSDWPHGLLAIGTFGNNNGLKQQKHEIQEDEEDQNTNNSIIEDQDKNQNPSPSDDDLQDFTPEEIGKLQKELTKLLSKKPTKEKEKEIANLPLDRFLNCPSSLEVDRRISTNNNNNPAGVSDKTEEEEEDDIERTISVILGRCKDICDSNKKKKQIGKKSISFLLKKMFVCSSGFAPQPTLRDTLQESRMEKLLRTLLHKKINPQNASRASSMKKYLEDKKVSNKGSVDDDEQQKRRKATSDGCKWVKTDSEYIVLEI